MSFEMMPKKEEIVKNSDLTIHDVYYPEFEEIKNTNPELYNKMLEDEIKKLEIDQKEQENSTQESIIDEETREALYKKEKTDLYYHN